MSKRLPYNRYLDRGTRRWIYQTAIKNLWRVSSAFDLDDLIQEGFLCYAICMEKYGKKAQNQKHFMSLLQTVFRNHITDLANDRSKGLKEIPVSQIKRKNELMSDEQLLEALGGREKGEAEMMVLFRDAPDMIHAVLDFVVDSRRQQKARVITQDRTTTNDALNRAVGTFGMDYQGQIAAFLGVPHTTHKTRFFVYNGDLEEAKGASLAIRADKGFSKRHKTFTVQRYKFHYLPQAA